MGLVPPIHPTPSKHQLLLLELFILMKEAVMVRRNYTSYDDDLITILYPLISSSWFSDAKMMVRSY
jgi:hypothetical protein